jgi:hypothetical protein
VTVEADISGRLIEVLRNAAGEPGLNYAREPEPLTGGFWAELLAFTLADPPAGGPAELVARLMPDPALARKETIVQSAVAAAGFPTPAVRAAGGPGSGLGRAFMIMDRAAGRSALSRLDGGLTPAAVPRLLRQVPDVLATAMGYRRRTAAGFASGELGWQQAVVALRALTEVAGWVVHQGVDGTRAGIRG